MKMISFLICFILFASPAFAGGVDFDKELAFLDAAEKSLQGCEAAYDKAQKALSKDKSDGFYEHSHKQTQGIINNAYDFKICTQEVFYSLLDHYYTDPEINEKMRDLLEDSTEKREALIAHIHHSSDFCHPSCGRIWEFKYYVDSAYATIPAALSIIGFHRHFYR